MRLRSVQCWIASCITVTFLSVVLGVGEPKWTCLHRRQHGVFQDVLALIVSPEFKDEIGHGNPSALILSGWALMLGASLIERCAKINCSVVIDLFCASTFGERRINIVEADRFNWRF